MYGESCALTDMQVAWRVWTGVLVVDCGPRRSLEIPAHPRHPRLESPDDRLRHRQVSQSV